MYLKLFLCFLILNSSVADKFSPDFTDNEFAEFEDFEVEDDIPPNDTTEKSPKDEKDNTVGIDDQEIIIDDDDSEFEHFQDNEEFEGFEIKDEKPVAEPKITIAKIPINFRQNWDSYYLEILMILGLVVYFINFATGKSKNTRIANSWFHTHRQLLEENFSLVGDDNSLDSNENVHLIKESENIFTLWCSGRTCCEGMLVELKLLKVK